MLRVEKERRALHAASAAASRLDLIYERIVVVSDAANTIVRFEPLPIVARVSPWPLADWVKVRLEREIAVALHLAAKGAPAVLPSRGISPGPHYLEDIGLSLWQFVDCGPAGDRDGPAAAAALRRLHGALADFPGALPSFTESIAYCAKTLRDPGALPGLPEEERAFLRRDHERTRAALEAVEFDSVPIHGDAHLGNLLVTDDGPIWGDLEAASAGPIEWDLACLPEAARSAYGARNQDLERILRRLRSHAVVIWCSALDDPNERQREAVDYHLGAMKREAPLSAAG